jgi:hypothetical protein
MDLSHGSAEVLEDVKEIKFVLGINRIVLQDKYFIT